MRLTNSPLKFALTFAIVASTLLLSATPAAAQQEKILRNFLVNSSYPTGGSAPLAGLIADNAGNLYGTTYNGGLGNCSLDGALGCGVVFELLPQTDGTWTEKVLHNFRNNGTDGYHPAGALVFDAAGNLYGTTYAGGNTTGCVTEAGSGCGTVFELTPQLGGSWAERILHNFTDNGADGYQPAASVMSLVLDGAGNLYGTTVQGGVNNLGTVFELSPMAGGSFTEKVIYNFTNDAGNGYNPRTGVTLDSLGNLYGTTQSGGNAQGLGTVYELSPTAGGSWTEKVLHRFARSDRGVGEGASTGVVFDAAGNLYGGTQGGESGFYGTLYELIPSGGEWGQKILDTYNGTGPTNLNFDSAGNLYVTFFRGGGSGLIFEWTPVDGGTWSEKLLHNFTSQTDGAGPNPGLVIDTAGNVFGTTVGGGSKDGGVVFEITP